MIQQGFKRKEDSWAFILTNNDIYNRCKTDTLSTFLKRQQERFMTKVISSEDDSVIERMTFNNDASHQRGPKRSLPQSVVANSNSQEAEFFKKALRKRAKREGDDPKERLRTTTIAVKHLCVIQLYN